MTKYGAIAIAVGWFAWAVLAGSGGAFAAEPVERGTSQRPVQPAGEPSATKSEPSVPNQGQAVPGRDDKNSARVADKRPLDLSLPPEAFVAVDSEGPATGLYRGLPGLQDTQKRNDPLRQMRQAFPALLAPQNEDNPVRIKGRLLMDQAKERSADAVDGGQIIIEVQTE